MVKFKRSDVINLPEGETVYRYSGRMGDLTLTGRCLAILI